MPHCKLPFAFSFTVVLFLLVVSWRVYSYAEIHYTFLRYSLINRPYPEVIMDVPWRVEPGEPIPIVCIVKDADRFPIKLEKVKATVICEGENIYKGSFLPCPEPLSLTDHYHYVLSYIDPPKHTGELEIILEAEFTKGGRRLTISADNLPGLSHAPFNVFVSSCKLPSFSGWYYGDPHYHSDMTQDQVEFGAPVEVAVAMGKAIGLNWLAVTDHSYDLDMIIGEFFNPDPKLSRWRKVLMDSELVNSKNNSSDGPSTDGFVVIPAEELSCGNCKSHNVHLLAFAISEFIPGRGDGVKKGFNRKPDLSLKQSVDRINQMGGFAYAAHPEVGNGLMGTLLLNRGHWQDQDYNVNDYLGLQFWNGRQDDKFDKSYKRWVQLLLEGRKLYILGGNDAHGDFNRCRKVKYPNTKLAESDDHVFGKVRTYAYCGNNISPANVLDALRYGRTVVTNGPVVIIQAQNDNGRIANIGDSISGRDFTLTINACSSEEFGRINKIDLYRGDLISKCERLEKTFIPEGDDTKCTFTYRIEGNVASFFRAEAKSSLNGKYYTCFTNPIWLL